jgi:hypothetical protein
VYGSATLFVLRSGSLTASENTFIHEELLMRFRERSSASSPRQRAARRLAEIEREIRHIKRLFPDLTNAASGRHRVMRTGRGHDQPSDGERSSVRYLIH